MDRQQYNDASSRSYSVTVRSTKNKVTWSYN